MHMPAFVRDKKLYRLERILTMVYVVQNSQNFSGIFHRPVFQKTRFGNWICFRPQVKVGKKTPTQLGPLERANLNHWIQFPKRRVFLEYRTMEKVQKNSVSSVQEIICKCISTSCSFVPLFVKQNSVVYHHVWLTN
jgi:hypothetical protein